MSELHARKHPAVVAGTCVMLVNGEIVYAGPINRPPGAPPLADGTLVLMHADDFRCFADYLKTKRH